MSLKVRPQGRAEHQGSRRDMAGRRAVVDQRAAFFGFQELCDIGHPDFQFQRRGYAVERLDALAFRFLAVLVQVNESRSDHEAAGMDDPSPGQRLGRDAGDLSVRMPTLRTASRPVSGSITRPPSSTRSYCCDITTVETPRRHRMRISFRIKSLPNNGLLCRNIIRCRTVQKPRKWQ